jgi:hypothetical protein
MAYPAYIVTYRRAGALPGGIGPDDGDSELLPSPFDTDWSTDQEPRDSMSQPTLAVPPLHYLQQHDSASLSQGALQVQVPWRHQPYQQYHVGYDDGSTRRGLPVPGSGWEAAGAQTCCQCRTSRATCYAFSGIFAGYCCRVRPPSMPAFSSCGGGGISDPALVT